MMNIKSDVIHIINKKLSEYKETSFKEVFGVDRIYAEGAEEKNIENCICHIKLIDELLRYYKKEDIVICSSIYKSKIKSEKSYNILNSASDLAMYFYPTLNFAYFKVNDIYNICKPVSSIDITICEINVFRNKNFSFNIHYSFDEEFTQLPRIQFCVSWNLGCILYNHNFLGHTQIQEEYAVNDYVEFMLLNPYKIPEIVASFVEINEILKSYFENVYIENSKLKKISNIIWITLNTFITKKIGDKIDSFCGDFKNNLLLLRFIGKNIMMGKFKIDVENYDSEDLSILIKDIEKLVNKDSKDYLDLGDGNAEYTGFGNSL